MELTVDELEHRNLLLRIEQFELKKLENLMLKQLEIARRFTIVQLEVKAQRMVCNSVKTDFKLSDFRMDCGDMKYDILDT